MSIEFYQLSRSLTQAVGKLDLSPIDIKNFKALRRVKGLLWCIVEDLMKGREARRRREPDDTLAVIHTISALIALFKVSALMGIKPSEGYVNPLPLTPSLDSKLMGIIYPVGMAGSFIKHDRKIGGLAIDPELLAPFHAFINNAFMAIIDLLYSMTLNNDSILELVEQSIDLTIKGKPDAN